MIGGLGSHRTGPLNELPGIQFVQSHGLPPGNRARIAGVGDILPVGQALSHHLGKLGHQPRHHQPHLFGRVAGAHIGIPVNRLHYLFRNALRRRIKHVFRQVSQGAVDGGKPHRRVQRAERARHQVDDAAPHILGLRDRRDPVPRGRRFWLGEGGDRAGLYESERSVEQRPLDIHGLPIDALDVLAEPNQLRRLLVR